MGIFHFGFKTPQNYKSCSRNRQNHQIALLCFTFHQKKIHFSTLTFFLGPFTWNRPYIGCQSLCANYSCISLFYLDLSALTNSAVIFRLIILSLPAIVLFAAKHCTICFVLTLNLIVFWYRTQEKSIAKNLDRVAPLITDPLLTSYTTLLKNKNKNVKCDIWHVTCDTWHVARDMWHVTCDMWHVTRDMWHVTCDTCHISDGEQCVKISGP